MLSKFGTLLQSLRFFEEVGIAPRGADADCAKVHWSSLVLGTSCRGEQNVTACARGIVSLEGPSSGQVLALYSSLAESQEVPRPL